MNLLLSLLFWIAWIILCFGVLSVVYHTDALPRFVLWVMHKFNRKVK